MIKVCVDPHCDAVYHNCPVQTCYCKDCSGRLIAINDKTYNKGYSNNYFQYDWNTGEYFKPGSKTKFSWNNNNVCMNPETVISKPGSSSFMGIEIHFAEKDGFYFSGFHCFTKTGGGLSPVSSKRIFAFPSKYLAIKDAIEQIKCKYTKMHSKDIEFLDSELEKYNEKLVEQLDLFKEII